MSEPWMVVVVALALAPVVAFGKPAAAAEPVAVPVLARAVERGEVLVPGDFEPQPRAPGIALGALPVKTAAGREMLRTLPAGAVVRAGDVVTPRLVRRGEPVTINLRADGLVIATAGRALSAGGKGDLVRVVATATSRTFDAVVEGSGAVRLAMQ